MRVLALDTTTRAGSAAVVVADRVVIERAGDAARSHGERLPGELWALLDDAGLTVGDIDLFAVASGPGSFTGLRIGIATIQGLALVRGRRVAAVSALEALAHAASDRVEPEAIVGSWMDAHRGQVFSALYRVERAPACTPERLLELDPARVGTPAVTLEAWRRIGAPSVIIGDGASLHAAAIDGRAAVVPPPLLAGTIGRIAAVRAARGDTLDPAAIQPLYVRRPDAELARELRSPR